MTSLDIAPTSVPVRLADAEIAPFLDKSAGVVVVDVSTQWCVPCRLLHPVMRKLAREFAGRMTVVEVDGDTAATFKAAHQIRSFPELLVFVDGKLAGRVGGFSGADKLRDALTPYLGAGAGGEPSPAELVFRNGFARAKAEFDRLMEAASGAFRPHYAAIAPAVEAMEAGIDAEVEAGRLSKADARARKAEETERLEAPIQDKIEAFEKAMEDALAAYDALMDPAVAEFARGHSPAPAAEPAAEVAGATCKPGDRFCAVR
jgi:thioredoxin-like negative regulator of GroEL